MGKRLIKREKIADEKKSILTCVGCFRAILFVCLRYR
jgi:hypothetical protein